MSASYGVPGGPRFSVFGDWEEVKVDSRHRIIGSGGVDNSYDPNSPPTAANYNWTGNVKDKSYAAGIAIDWPAMDKLSLKASAIYYKTDGYVDLSLQDGVPSSVVRAGAHRRLGRHEAHLLHREGRVRAQQGVDAHRRLRVRAVGIHRLPDRRLPATRSPTRRTRTAT